MAAEVWHQFYVRIHSRHESMETQKTVAQKQTKQEAVSIAQFTMFVLFVVQKHI